MALLIPIGYYYFCGKISLTKTRMSITTNKAILLLLPKFLKLRKHFTFLLPTFCQGYNIPGYDSRDRGRHKISVEVYVIL